MFYTKLSKQILKLHRKIKIQKKNFRLKNLKQVFQFIYADFNHTFFIINALNKCDKKKIYFLRELNNLQKKSFVKILLINLSHLNNDIKKTFVTSFQIEIDAKNSDLKIYLSIKVDDNNNVNFIDKDFKTEIIVKIIQRTCQI